MAIRRFADRCMQRSVSAGTGALTLSAPETGFRTLSAVYAQDEDLPYAIEGVAADESLQGEWEVGRGHLDASGHLVRDMVFASSTGLAVAFTAPSLRVFVTEGADAILEFLDARRPNEIIALVTNAENNLGVPFLKGSFNLVGADFSAVKFLTLGSVSRAGLTGTIELFNLTDNVTIISHTVTTTTPVRQLSAALTLPAGAKTYEVRIRVDVPLTPADMILLAMAAFQVSR